MNCSDFKQAFKSLKQCVVKNDCNIIKTFTKSTISIIFSPNLYPLISLQGAFLDKILICTIFGMVGHQVRINTNCLILFYRQFQKSI